MINRPRNGAPGGDSSGRPSGGVRETDGPSYSTPQENLQAKALDPVSWNEVVSDITRSKPIVGNILSEVVLSSNSDSFVTLSAGNNFQMESLKRNPALYRRHAL